MKILLVQTSFLGDTILSTPLIAGIKKLYPHAELWVMSTVESKELLESDPLVSGVITFDKKGKDRGIRGMLAKASQLRKADFDVVFSLHRSYRTAILLFLSAIPKRIGFESAGLAALYTRKVARPKDPHDVIRNLSLLKNEEEYAKSGLSLENFFDTNLRLFTKENRPWQENLAFLTKVENPIAVLFPGSAWNTKMWNWKGYREVVQYLLAQHWHVILLGAPSENKVCQLVADGTQAVNLAGSTSIADTLRIVKLASLVVCNDSMALHMASAFKIPNVSIFCATSPKFGFGPWNNNAQVVEKAGLACKPCRRHGGHKCPTGTRACMDELPSDAVVSAIERVLEKVDLLRAGS